MGAVFQRVRTVTIDNKTVKLQLWDTAGQERFRAITSHCFRGADGVIAVFDTTNEVSHPISKFLWQWRVQWIPPTFQQSFLHLPYWLEQIEKHAPEKVKLMLVGNKCDLGMLRAVESAKAREFASEHRMMDYFETSAKDCTNVDQVGGRALHS
jgi:GTPase SAR1 family protein